MKFLKAIVPVLIILGVTWLVVGFLRATRPEAEKRSRPVRPPAVDAIRVNPGSYEVVIETRGEVRARTRSVLIPEVPGRVLKVSPNFRDGGFFEQDDVLVEIDPRDYQTAATVAASNVAEATNAYEQEKARAAQAKENWERLGKGRPANDLVLRVPQLAEAKARLDAAVAELDQAEVDLQRTKIRAPYAGRVLEQLVDVGQYVSNGSTLARVFAVDYAEIRLPLTDRQSAFVDLREDFRGESEDADDADLPRVTLAKRAGTREFTWDGKIVRSEGAIDTRSRQLFVIAQVDDPYRKRDDGTPPLKVGDFVEARIAGRTLDGVYTIPRTAIRGNRVLVVDAGQRVRSREVEIAWGDDENVVVTSGLEPGEAVCTTPPAYATEGAKVLASIPGEKRETPQKKHAQR